MATHIGTEWSETTAGTNSGATASHAAGASSGGSPARTHIVTSISGHVDADSIVQILGGAAGATVVWESKIDISVEGISFNFPGLNVIGVPGIKVEGKIASSSADCQVNVSGYSIP
jgi:hypothetical protein